jgi:hypothetical protein
MRSPFWTDRCPAQHDDALHESDAATACPVLLHANDVSCGCRPILSLECFAGDLSLLSGLLRLLLPSLQQWTKQRAAVQAAEQHRKCATHQQPCLRKLRCAA